MQFIHESHQFLLQIAFFFPVNVEVLLKYNNQLLVLRNQSNYKKMKHNSWNFLQTSLLLDQQIRDFKPNQNYNKILERDGLSPALFEFQ